MDLHWKVCPYCGNNRFDPYQVGPPLILAEDVVAAREAPDSDDADEALIQERLDFIEAEDEIEDSELEPPQVQD
jgi:hypothetical protein